jgi:hypothetical protein
MRRFLLSFIGFVALSIIAYLVLVIVWGLAAPRVLRKNIAYKFGSYGFTYSRIKDISRFSKIDVLCIGSSHCYRGYDPRIFEKAHLSIFNLGTSAQTPIQTELLLKENFDRLKPRAVIVDVYPPVFDNDGVESTLNLIANAPIDRKLIDLSLSSKNIKVFNTLVYGLFRQSLRLDRNYVQPAVMDSDTYIGRGYVQTYQHYQPAGPFKPRSVQLWPAQMEAFRRVVAFLKSKQVPYVIIQAPVTRANFESYTNNRSIDSLLTTMGPYINANDYFHYPDSCFLDDHHLNQRGVDRYDPAIIRMIDSICF